MSVTDYGFASSLKDSARIIAEAMNSRARAEQAKAEALVRIAKAMEVRNNL